MRFFVPGEDDAEAAWERMREACGALGTRPLYSLTYEEDGTEVVAKVGEDGMIAIMAGQPFYIFFEVPENPRSVPWESVTEMAFFDEG